MPILFSREFCAKHGMEYEGKGEEDEDKEWGEITSTSWEKFSSLIKAKIISIVS